MITETIRIHFPVLLHVVFRRNSSKLDAIWISEWCLMWTLPKVTLMMLLNALFCYWQEDMDRFGDISTLDDNMEQFLSHDGDGRELYGSLKQSSAEHQKEPSKGRYGLQMVGMAVLILPETIS